MSDHQSLISALDTLTLEEKERFLAGVLAASPALLEMLLPRLPLRNLPENIKARICFQMQITPVGHAHRNAAGVLNWELPQVPEPLRPLVYSLSRLIGEFQSAMAAMVNGRGDFTRAFTLLNPASIQEMTDKVRAEMQPYATALREASGRRTRPPASAATPKPTTEQAPVTAKSKRSGAKAKATASEQQAPSADVTPDNNAGEAGNVSASDLFLDAELKESSPAGETPQEETEA